MSLTVTFHIGPMKTGSTSVQSALADSAADLLSRGVLYDVSGGWTPNHMRATVDLLPRLPDVAMTPGMRAVIKGFGPRCDGAWDALVNQVLSFPGHAVISQEALAFLGPQSAAEVAAAFPGVRLRAVVVDRPLPRLLASIYQQEAKLVLVADFDTYVRDALADPPLFPWLDPHWITRTWESAGVEVEVIQARPDLSTDTLRATLSAILPHGVAVPTPQRSNISLTAAAIDVWRCATARFRPRYLGAAVGALNDLMEKHGWATDPALGGRYVIRSDEGQTWTERIDGSARVDLDTEVRTLGRRFRRSDAAFTIAEAVGPLRRRPAPLRTSWDAGR